MRTDLAIAYDVFKFQKVREPAMALSGLASAVLR